MFKLKHDFATAEHCMLASTELPLITIKIWGLTCEREAIRDAEICVHLKQIILSPDHQKIHTFTVDDAEVSNNNDDDSEEKDFEKDSE